MRPRPSKFKTSSSPLGVDLVEIQKAAAFYRAHRRRLGSYFGKEELRSIRRSAKPHQRLALLLAAKEAIFKATYGRRTPPSNRRRAGADVLVAGPTAFSRVRVLPKAARPRKFRLTAFKNKDFVVVECRPKNAGDKKCIGTF